MTKKLFLSICHAEKIAILSYPQVVPFGAGNGDPQFDHGRYPVCLGRLRHRRLYWISRRWLTVKVSYDVKFPLFSSPPTLNYSP